MPRFGPPGEQIGYRVYDGPRGAPPLFLIHGFTASSASFATNIAPLAREFTVVTVDLLGHGDSEAPETIEPYGPGPAVERIVGLIERLGYKRVMLCGHSLGGAVALRVALDAPERVAALVVINSNSAAGTPEWRDRAAPGLAQLAERVRSDGTAFMRRTRLYPAASKRLPEDARELLIRDFEALTPQGVAGTALALTVPVNAFERLPELSVPTLVVIGDRDREFVRSSAAFLDQLPADLTSWVTIEDAGHAANLEQAEEFEAALVEYARELGYLGSGTVTAVPVPSGRRSGALTVIGLALIAAGFIMVAGAFLIDQDEGSGQVPVAFLPTEVAAEATATPTLTPVESSAGVRTPGPEVVTPTPVQAAPTAPAADTPAPGATDPAPTPTTAQPVVAQPTPTPAETPTEAPTEEPSPTPSGPFASISGPSTSPVGVSQSFIGNAPGALRVTWDGCSAGMIPNSCSQFFDAAGCYSITMVAFFEDQRQPVVAGHTVAVGDAVCQ